MLKSHEKLLCELLKCALQGNTYNKNKGYTEDDWKRAVSTAAKHSVLPLLYDTAADTCPVEMKQLLENTAVRTVQQGYHLLFLSKYVLNLLDNNGIRAVLLKGSTTASLYPVPELRKSGDVDLLLENIDVAGKACTLLQEQGFAIKEEQHSNHHITCTSPDGIDIELHVMLTEPFDNDKVNNYIEEVRKGIFGNITRKNVMDASLCAMPEQYHAFYLLLHMLQHFMRSGFGLKLICDWVVFWNRELEEAVKKQFLILIKESGTYGFARMVTVVCVCYLGLDACKVSFILNAGTGKKDRLEQGIVKHDVLLEDDDKEDAREFLEEIFEAGEFGKSSPDRMVVLRGTGITAYIREFHHQMKLTYPASGRIFILWPVLWVMTLAGFIHRNKSIRNVSGTQIFKKTAQRSKIVKKMGLFQKGTRTKINL